MDDYLVSVVANNRVGPDVYQMVLQGKGLPIFTPGQFCLLSVLTGCNLLPRPLGVSWQENDCIEVIYRVVGAGTAQFATLKQGDTIKLRGPAGCGFSKPTGPVVGFAGTLGIVPLLLWRKVYGPFKKLCFGVPNGSWEPFANWVKERVPETELFCDSGDFGATGSCLCGLEQLQGNERLIGCGPNGMLCALAKNSPQQLPLEVSLERRMGCGFGGCHGCVVTSGGKSKRLCVEGPVLNGREVDWIDLAL